MIAGPTAWEMFVLRWQFRLKAFIKPFRQEKRVSVIPPSHPIQLRTKPSLKLEFNPMRKIFGYMRVSTQDQNLDLQRDALERAVATDFIEEKASGAKTDRPELLRMLELAREGDKIVVWRLDRLARSMKQLIEIIEGLESKSIQFQSVTECIDTSSSGGKLVFGIFASLAEFERSLIRERTLSGLGSCQSPWPNWRQTQSPQRQPD